MSENDSKTDASKISDVPVSNEIYTIPVQFIEQWFKINKNDYVDLNLTRLDIDKIFSSFYKLYVSIEAMQQCIIHYSNGRIESASNEMLQSQKSSSEALSEARQAMSTIMVSSVVRTKK